MPGGGRGYEPGLILSSGITVPLKSSQSVSRGIAGFGVLRTHLGSEVKLFS